MSCFKEEQRTARGISFISGGVRSGKSSFAEKWAEGNKKRDGRLVYIATAKPTDHEMIERIRKHQHDRLLKNESWITIEQERDLSNICGQLRPADTVLVDCLTIWLSNEMFAHSEQRSMQEVQRNMCEALHYVQEACSHLVIVSNDIFHEMLPEAKETKAYVQALGQLHQYIVRHAGAAVKLEFGKPIWMKGGR
ncbi:bifunctional adenosylcobinamide kinase/adenosylcobinamide-phosphate guanylyltransferase [Bacillus piscicola]|uniref:bifunctional adenosylcobinamide kinase/adenosylcobinamide-phosphate guanylyltransferase n=1 Tax=Bacillus piscicola TaxID=1632684 RepID=UPI001F09F79A|nr:bifunctional adenosylcobinamide kinase/adenosylcobinamide-phosphate guanylyltransferase [Bacillus piscicola]